MDLAKKYVIKILKNINVVKWQIIEDEYKTEIYLRNKIYNEKDGHQYLILTPTGNNEGILIAADDWLWNQKENKNGLKHD